MALRRWLHSVLVGLLLSTPISGFAQLATGSAWQASKWDFLNLYQGTTTTNLKPEILLLLDDTGSTSRLMFHPLFPINWQDEAPPNSPSSSNSADYSLVVSFSSFPTSNAQAPGITVGFNSGGGGNATTTVKASGNTYTIGGARKIDSTSGLPVNTLVDENGNEVTYSEVSSTVSSYTAATSTNKVSSGKDDPVNWILAASHVRLQCTVGSVTRTIDFPLSFVPLDATTSLNTSTGALIPAVATDPSTGSTYPFDTENFINSVAASNSPTSSKPNYAYMNGGFYTTTGYIRSRYIEWVFWGQDPGSPGGTAYCIPNAIAGSAAAMFADAPSKLSYNGAAGVWQTGGTTTSAFPAFTNLLPNRTRGQAIKECVIKTWLSYYTKVMLAIRTFSATGTTCSSTITANTSGSAITSTVTPAFGSTNWYYMDPTQIAAQVASFAGCTWSNGDSTPLTASTLSALCQMTNPAAFAPLIAQNGYTQAQLQCQHHFLITLTDGAPSETPTPAEAIAGNFPYYQTIGSSGNPAFTGNAVVKASPASLTSSSTTTTGPGFWNIATLAGMAAHGGEGSSSSPTWIRDPLTEGLTGALTSLSSGGGWAPLWVTQRTVGGKAFTFTQAQSVQTMTVGVSLGVDYYSAITNTGSYTLLPAATAPTIATPAIPILSDFNGSKFRLLYTAYFGDPSEDDYDITAAVPFYLASGSTQKSSDAAYFFDGRDPTTLVNNISAAFQQIVQKSTVNTTSAPVFPTVGAGTGQEVYVGMFLPPTNPGPLWIGDMLMFPTQATATGSQLVDGSGNPITGSLTAVNAQWSAAAAILNRQWQNRVIYTRLPPTTGTSTSAPNAWNPGLTQVNLGANGTNTANAGYQAILPYLPGSTSTIQLANWQYFVGADVGGTTTTPLPTRSATFPGGTAGLMGDVIDSTPAVLQYSTLPSSVATASSTLSTAWNLHNGSTGSTDSTGMFRMIFVGDNQGLFHAFGEVSWITTPTNSSGTVVAVTEGVVDELWAFAPTEILPNIDQLRVSTNMHYYAVDGAPTIYLLDLPQPVNGVTGAVGDGMFDVGAVNPERALVIFGLGKGGRSYYALNIADPANPSMQWALCPNEQYNVPSSRVKGGSASVISLMGLSTPQPTLARLATSAEGVGNQVVDAVLLGGGYSDLNIEKALPATATTTVLSSTPSVNSALGRSVVALDVWTGNILNTWSTAGVSGAGPVTSAVIPLVLVPGSGIVERSYFTDYYGSLWALGGTAPQPSPYTMFRTDTAILDNWNLRQVYTQPVSAGSAGNGLITTSPAPFLLSSFPVTRTTAPLVNPTAVGIAFVTGDRNNPLDFYTYTPWSAPTQHRTNVVFDRQDVNTVLSATNIVDATSSSVTFSSPGAANSYLQSYDGYFSNFPSPAGGFVPKGITSPLVLDGALFYSYFNPLSATCAGGTGTTSTYRICNVMAPAVSSTFNTTVATTAPAISGCQSGWVLYWTGVASNMTTTSIATGVQAGLTSGSGTTDVTTASQNITIQNLDTQSTDIYPKIRVWRDVH